jgi:hypothetical protein
MYQGDVPPDTHLLLLFHHLQKFVQLIDGNLGGREVLLVAGYDAIGIDSLGRTVLESILKIGEARNEGVSFVFLS